MLELITLSLATWRVSSLIASEAGPFNLFGRLRSLLGVFSDEDGNVYGTNELARGITCVWCCSVWVGAAFALGYWLIPDAIFWLALPFALSAGAVVVEEVTSGES